ncbi:uncharacterized protein F4807DRAFT_79302 [Annulohypoxylon truncatum]|uniref:uncharacterized protein n=1 Tax=Annulohypoxylon truncatum TaxID=327061 RepID=UPI0020084744|nr:uncharacterized protein F4807DRAFT_79302 [Annulohypoxylon truncatum]KAI1209944.1 hypothetical protein F4807DRAFT_79302 [Annulohypoxylon truncatum]
MSNLGPLTTVYSASGANCNSIYMNDNGVLIYGTVSPSSSSCFPTSFVPWDDNYYSPGICPSGYTYACTAGVGNGGTAATCCPISYQCRIGRVSSDPAACESLMLTDSSYTVSQYISSGSETWSSLVTKFYASGNFVFAGGAIVRRASNDPGWYHIDSVSGTVSELATPTTSSTTTTNSRVSSGLTQGVTKDNTGTSTSLSTGAKAGIGIGVSLGVLVIIGIVVTAYLIGKRKRQAIQGDTSNPSLHGGLGFWDARQFQTWHVRLAELDEQKGHSELNGEREPVELMGHQ